jgi:hypothetical protein
MEQHKQHLSLKTFFALLIVTCSLPPFTSCGSSGSNDSASTTAAAASNSTGSLTLATSAVTIAPEDTYQVSASGGVPPYTYTLETGGIGSVSTTGLYTAPDSEGSAAVQVTDSAGSQVVCDITILTSANTSTTTVVTDTYSGIGLSSYNSGCTESTPFGMACNAAIDGYCRNNGYITGYGSVSASGNNTQFVCTGEGSTFISTTYATLNNYDSSCVADGQPYGPTCRSAVNRYCAAKGYVSGFGPVEDSDGVHGNVSLGCVDSTIATYINSTFSVLSDYDSGCSNANENTMYCMNAIHIYCLEKGYTSGFGPTEFSGNNVWFTCIH